MTKIIIILTICLLYSCSKENSVYSGKNSPLFPKYFDTFASSSSSVYEACDIKCCMLEVERNNIFSKLNKIRKLTDEELLKLIGKKNVSLLTINQGDEIYVIPGIRSKSSNVNYEYNKKISHLEIYYNFLYKGKNKGEDILHIVIIPGSIKSYIVLM